MRNIVLITADSFRADHCGFLGSTYETTPTMDVLAEESIVFESAIAPGPRTPSSMPVLFTGEHIRPENRGVYQSWEEKRTRWRERRKRIRQHMTRYRTLAERLHERGYATAGITVNPWTTRSTGFDQGFDVFRAAGDDPGMRRDGYFADIANRLTGGRSSGWLLRWTDFYDVVRQIRHSLTKPYFLWVFLLDTHQPYIVPRSYQIENTALEMYYSNIRFSYNHNPFERLADHLHTRFEQAYRDACRSIDGFVQTLVSDIQDDDPVVVFHADHGEAFHEHGTYGHRPQLYEENIHVPLLAYGAGHSVRVRQPISLRQLPDFVESLSVPNNINPEELTTNVAVTKTEERERIAVRGRIWKYISGAADWEYVLGEGDELYTLSEDLHEQSNCINKYPAIARTYKGYLAHHEESLAEYDRISQAVRNFRTSLRNQAQS